MSDPFCDACRLGGKVLNELGPFSLGEILDYNDEPFAGWLNCKACGLRFGFSRLPQGRDPAEWTLVPAPRDVPADLGQLFRAARTQDRVVWLRIVEQPVSKRIRTYICEQMTGPPPETSWEIQGLASPEAS